jgi:hypothetical protein
MKKQAMREYIVELEARNGVQAATIRDLRRRLHEAETPPPCEVEECGDCRPRVLAGLFFIGCAVLAIYYWCAR